MKVLFSLLLFILILNCNSQRYFRLPIKKATVYQTGGTDFFKKVASFHWKQRDSLATSEILAGNIPSFLKRLVAIKIELIDSSTGMKYKAVYFVTPDYLSIGTDKDWVRIPLTPMAAQQIADKWNCFLPTRKMVNDIYRQAVVKLDPVPMYAFRDSSIIMWHHHLIIEGQRKLRKGLIAGIKKDVVISGGLFRYPKSGHEAIYGWHKPDSQPIQPLYLGHVNWWVDYSHGIRLIYRKIKVNGKMMDYKEVLGHPVLKNLLCDEEFCDFYRYDY